MPAVRFLSLNTPTAPSSRATAGCRSSKRRARVGFAALAAMCVAWPGCGEDHVTHARVPKMATPAQAVAADPHAAAVAPAQPQTTTAAAAVLPLWTLPANWKQTPGNGMRYATLQPEGDGAPELTVVKLGGTAGGELANVNRWRGQVGLGPADDAALAGLRTTVTSKAGAVHLYDFVGQGADATRMLAAIWTDNNGDTWFFKTNGNPSAVEGVRPGLLALLETLRLE